MGITFLLLVVFLLACRESTQFSPQPVGQARMYHPFRKSLFSRKPLLHDRCNGQRCPLLLSQQSQFQSDEELDPLLEIIANYLKRCDPRDVDKLLSNMEQDGTSLERFTGSIQVEWKDKQVNATHVIRRFTCTGATFMNKTDSKDAAEFQGMMRSLHPYVTRKSAAEQTARKRLSRLVRKAASYMIAFSVFVAAARFIPHTTSPPVSVTSLNRVNQYMVEDEAQEDSRSGDSLPLSSEELQDLQSPLVRSATTLSRVSATASKVGPSVVRIDSDLGQGSGFIFSSVGLVLTNAHVVSDAFKLAVTLADGRVFHAEVRGSDDILDVAVLKIVPNDNEELLDLPFTELGDSNTLSVGQLVIALGCPLGMENTVTMGIVSNLERLFKSAGNFETRASYIQSDTAVNHGSSGVSMIV